MDDDYAALPVINTSTDITLPGPARIVCDTSSGDITITIPPGGDRWTYAVSQRGGGTVWVRRPLPK